MSSKREDGSAPLLRINHVKKEYPGVVPLRDVNLTVEEGDVISVIGPSGTGKSTLLRMINRMEEATAGEIFFHDEEITSPSCDTGKLRQKIGMIFQSFNLFPHLTVIENIMAAPVALKNLSKQEAYDKAKALLGKVGLVEKMFGYPRELSGGQQQRIAIVRALAMEPELLLLDEPTSALDPTMTGEVESVLNQLGKDGVTMMIVTHSMELARRVSSRVLYMDEGEIYEEGTPDEIFTSPRREKTRQFIHRLKVLTIVVEQREFDFVGKTNEINVFAQKNGVPRLMTHFLLLLFEELVVHLILPRIAESPCIVWSLEYDAKNEQAQMSVNYNGGTFNAMEGGDELSVSVIRRCAKTVRYESVSDEKMPNHIFATVALSKD